MKILKEWYETEKNYQNILEISITHAKKKMIDPSFRKLVSAE